jgi:hypothetical protein
MCQRENRPPYMRRFSFRSHGSRGLFRRYYRLLTNWVTILPCMPWVFGGMDARMNKARVRAGLEARRLEAARLPQIGVEPPEVARRLKVSQPHLGLALEAGVCGEPRSDRGKRSWRGGALRKGRSDWSKRSKPAPWRKDMPPICGRWRAGPSSSRRSAPSGIRNRVCGGSARN